MPKQCVGPQAPSGMGVSFLVHAPVRPAMVRYTANKAFPQCAVYGREGLPALPFQLAGR